MRESAASRLWGDDEFAATDGVTGLGIATPPPSRSWRNQLINNERYISGNTECASRLRHCGLCRATILFCTAVSNSLSAYGTNSFDLRPFQRLRAGSLRGNRANQPRTTLWRLILFDMIDWDVHGEAGLPNQRFALNRDRSQPTPSRRRDSEDQALRPI